MTDPTRAMAERSANDRAAFALNAKVQPESDGLRRRDYLPSSTPLAITSQASRGQPLPHEPAVSYGPRFGADLSHVRIHADASAAALAEAASARAFTLGSHIFFNHGEYRPETGTGRALLAHELAHITEAPDGPAWLLRQAKGQVSASDTPTDTFTALRGPATAGQASPGTVRQPRRLVGPPLFLGPPAVVSAQMQEYAAMVNRFPAAGRGYIDEWLDAAARALDVAKLPDDPAVTRNWWISLGGNLVWAAMGFTIFVENPSLAVKVATMGGSFAGAMAGSGVFSREPAPSGRTFVMDRLEQAADAAERGMHPLIAGAAVECIERKITAQEEQDKFLWSALMGGVAYGERRGAMRILIQGRLERALESYMRQYYEWEAELKGMAWLEASEDTALITVTNSTEMGAQMQVSSSLILKRLKNEHPFRATLELGNPRIKE